MYSLTEAGIQVLPIMAALGNWGLAHRDGSRRLRVRAGLLRDGGPDLVAGMRGQAPRTPPRHPAARPHRARANGSKPPTMPNWIRWPVITATRVSVLMAVGRSQVGRLLTRSCCGLLVHHLSFSPAEVSGVGQ